MIIKLEFKFKIIFIELTLIFNFWKAFNYIRIILLPIIFHNYFYFKLVF